MDITLQPAVLQWARERAGYTRQQLADKMHLKSDKVEVWEQTGELTLSRAQKLAQVTHTPFGYLFLRKPPVEALPIKDFRTVEMQDIVEPSANLLDSIYFAQRVQDWYRDYLISIDRQPLNFVGSLRISNNISQAAARIRRAVSWDENQSVQSGTWEDALTRYIGSVRDIGVVVIRTSVVGYNNYRSLDTEEFRGFSLADDYAPLIFINSADAKAAQIFTLAHELAHIWLGISGVSNLRSSYSPDRDTEQFCNQVAAEMLVPMQEFQEYWAGVEYSPDNIALASRHFKVSKLVILRRMRDGQLLSQDEFQRLYIQELQESSNRKPKKEDRGGDFQNLTISRYGERFLSALLSSTFAGETSYRDSLHLLGLHSVETMRKLNEEMGKAI